MTRRRATAIAIVAGVAVLAAVLVSGWRRPTIVGVPAGADVGQFAASHPGAVLELAPGEYPSFAITTTAEVRGGAGVVVDGPVTVSADGVVLRDLLVLGGDTGVSVRDVDDVRLEAITVRGAALHGIEIVDASAVIDGCAVGGLGAQGQGVEVRNAAGRGRTVVRGCTVDGGFEGLVSHVSRVEFLDNSVTGTTRRAIAIMEMSEALVARNDVADAVGAALFCGDMSHCEFVGNRAERVRSDGSGIRSRSGWGAVAWYYSSMRLRDNVFTVDEPGQVLISDDSTLTTRFPLGVWPQGWRGALPILPIGLAAITGLAAVRFLVVPFLRRRSTPRTDRRQRPLALAALAGGFAVQSFHMIEHGVQVWQVEVADAEIRAGLVGQSFSTEWLHFGFNVAVMALLVLFWHHARRTGGTFAGAGRGAAWLAAALVAQGYHVVEHTAKVGQHLATGARVTPGLVGDDLGLVWFHFAINLAVYAGTAVAAWEFAQAAPRLVAARARLVGTTRPQTT